MFDQEKSEATVFNMSLATLERIDKLLKALEEHMIMGRVLFIQRNIMALYKELYPFLKQEEKEYSMKEFEDIRVAVTCHGTTYSINDSQIKVKMNNFDFWIRDKLLQKGLLMAQGENPETALW